MSDFPTCEVCGSGESGVTITGRSGEPLTILCESCQRFIDLGMFRVEIDEKGRRRYRQWHIQPMTPGDLLPVPS